MLPRRILVVHGKGAVGKTSLLRMYRLTCQTKGIPVALVGADDAHSSVDLLDRWASDLRDHGAPLPTFAGSLKQLHALNAKVEAKAGPDPANQVTEGVAKVAVVAGSLVPVVGPAVAAVGPEAIEAVLNMARALLSKEDYEFFSDPTTRLTRDFLSDLEKVAARTRPVLMLDTLEQVTALDEWLRGLIRALPPNVLVVVAGQDVPDWSRAWPEWIAEAEVLELREMSDEDVAELVRRYYGLFGRGDADEEFVRDVVRFARGLPVAATTMVELGVTHGFSSLELSNLDVIADLAERLLRETPAELRPALEGAAVLRYFNSDSLSALIDDAPASLYDDIRRWPFTRPRREGLAVHESIRDVITEALRGSRPSGSRSFRCALQLITSGYSRVRATTSVTASAASGCITQSGRMKPPGSRTLPESRRNSFTRSGSGGFAACSTTPTRTHSKPRARGSGFATTTRASSSF